MNLMYVWDAALSAGYVRTFSERSSRLLCVDVI